jgi:hypothetical protein
VTPPRGSKFKQQRPGRLEASAAPVSRRAGPPWKELLLSVRQRPWQGRSRSHQSECPMWAPAARPGGFPLGIPPRKPGLGRSAVCIDFVSPRDLARVPTAADCLSWAQSWAHRSSGHRGGARGVPNHAGPGLPGGKTARKPVRFSNGGPFKFTLDRSGPS